MAGMEIKRTAYLVLGEFARSVRVRPVERLPELLLYLLFCRHDFTSKP